MKCNSIKKRIVLVAKDGKELHVNVIAKLQISLSMCIFNIMLNSNNPADKNFKILIQSNLILNNNEVLTQKLLTSKLTVK